MEVRKPRGPQPMENPLERIQVMLPPELIQDIKARADRDELSLSPWLRQKITEIVREDRI